MLQTVKQVAVSLNVTPPTVWRYVREDLSFPRPLRLSRGCTRWRDEEIKQWVDTRPNS